MKKARFESFFPEAIKGFAVVDTTISMSDQSDYAND